MLLVSKNLNKLLNNKLPVRLTSSYFLPRRGSFEIDGNNFIPFNQESLPIISCHRYNSQFLNVTSKFYSPLIEKRYFSKKKGSKRNVEEEESDSDEDEPGGIVNEEDFGDSVITKNVPSIRLDSVIKAGLGVSKKKIEQDFYAFKLRVNREKVVKKSLNVYLGDEIDRIRGFSPDTSKFLLVDRIIIKGIDKVTGTGMFPVKMEIFKSLTIENYEDPWSPDSVGQLQK